MTLPQHGCAATIGTSAEGERSPVPTAPVGDPWRAHTVRIAGVVDEVPGVRTYDLRFLDETVALNYRFAPGQFNMLHLPGIGEAAISISSDPAEPAQLAHTVRSVGNVTDALARLQVGDTLMLRGPFGRPWPIASRGGRDLVLVAGGLGLASQRAAIRQLARQRARYASVTVLHGAKEPASLLYTSEYQAWKEAGLVVRCIVDGMEDQRDTTSAAWDGRVGLVTDLLNELTTLSSNTTLLCCGPDPMMTAVAHVAMRRGVVADEVFLSLERNMACAVRHCGLCQFGPVFVCQDGPVFPYAAIEPFLRVPHL
ncbi:MAG: FAD/NAD(P)-binding protein [Pirellulales bacterium]|jgi:NAD(P)H-flavin reductase